MPVFSEIISIFSTKHVRLFFHSLFKPAKRILKTRIQPKHPLDKIAFHTQYERNKTDSPYILSKKTF